MMNRKLCYCGNFAESKGLVNGRRYYAKVCSTCRKNKHKSVQKKTRCEACGFIAMHPCQIDLDHIDGDKSNNSADNLWSLCANCHRLKTFLCSDWSN